MLLRLLVDFYFAFGPTLLVAQHTHYHEDAYDSVDLIWRQDTPSFGFKMYPQANFIGTGVLKSTASVNNSIPLGASFQPLGGAWGALTSSSQDTRVIIWDPASDVSALPLTNVKQLEISDIQSSSCSPACTSSGTCNPSSPVCTCPNDGFNGTLCETCAEGHFGPSCLPCPSNCKNCDQGISGSGRCLVPEAKPSKCKCVNGTCDDNGKCICLPGYGPSSDGAVCAKCLQGFFLSKNGGCQACQIGCDSCEDNTGNCDACQDKFTQDPTDPTKCNPPSNVKSNGTPCPPGSYNDGTNSTHCPNCSPFCETCTGPTSGECTRCAPLRAMLKKNCVATNGVGNCQGTNGTSISDNVNRQCQSCGVIGPNCQSCAIQGFSIGSTLKKVKCTQCLDEFFLTQDGKCVAKCPPNTFASDNSCKPCSSVCGSCAGDSKHCLTCGKGQLALSGNCVTSCPTGTFASNGTCINCHPDCKTCGGSSFNQCKSCPKTRPVLQGGRCLPTCKRSQYFDSTTSTCKNCDPSCSSCSGSGPKRCLACKTPEVFMVVNGVCASTPQLVLL